MVVVPNGSRDVGTTAVTRRTRGLSVYVVGLVLGFAKEHDMLTYNRLCLSMSPLIVDPKPSIANVCAWVYRWRSEYSVR
jgi:hypothetical protein